MCVTNTRTKRSALALPTNLLAMGLGGSYPNLTAKAVSSLGPQSYQFGEAPKQTPQSTLPASFYNVMYSPKEVEVPVEAPVYQTPEPVQAQYPVVEPICEKAPKKKRARRRKAQKPGKTAKLHDRHFVRHNYHDHSRDTELKVQIHEHKDEVCDGDHKPRRHGGVSIAFPVKLHDMLESIEGDGLGHIVSWQPHGRAFVVHKPKEFVEDVMPRYFRQSKLTSFQRQLNLYGFSRLTRGKDNGGYYHELFLKAKPFLSKQMKRTKVKGIGFKAASSPETEPDFYNMPPVLVTPSSSVGDCSSSSCSANTSEDHNILETGSTIDFTLTEVPRQFSMMRRADALSPLLSGVMSPTDMPNFSPIPIHLNEEKFMDFEAPRQMIYVDPKSEPTEPSNMLTIKMEEEDAEFIQCFQNGTPASPYEITQISDSVLSDVVDEIMFADNSKSNEEALDDFLNAWSSSDIDDSDTDDSPISFHEYTSDLDMEKVAVENDIQLGQLLEHFLE
eukprot:scaffold146825_cov35-Attheya_sp.AAC.1